MMLMVMVMCLIRYSGLTKEKMENVTTPFHQAQQDFLRIVSRCVLLLHYITLIWGMKMGDVCEHVFIHSCTTP